jgi:(p)ppGpp synthase/HD superfamily hydrolase
MAQAALRFARARHAGQRREIDHAPFIDHPIEVAWLLRRDGQPDEVIAAGLLHDVLEKTATTSAELRRRFGARIARLVESVSDDPSIRDYELRKRDLRDRIAQADLDTRAVFAADKIAKVRELALLPAWQLTERTTRAKSPITVPASRCSTGPQVSSHSSISSTPSSSRSSRLPPPPDVRGVDARTRPDA